MSTLGRLTTAPTSGVTRLASSGAAESATARADSHLRHVRANAASRYGAFTGWLDRLRADAHGGGGRGLPPERLAAQQAQIFRRLEALERPARVIAFPRFTPPGRRLQPARPQRWIAAAAAAGLIIGVGVGPVARLPARRRAGRLPSTQARRASAPPGRGRARRPAGLAGRATRRSSSSPSVAPRRRACRIASGRSTRSPRARGIWTSRGSRGRDSSPLIFRKGLDMKEAVAGELAAAYHSAIVDEVRAQRLPPRRRPPHRPPRARVRLLLRRRSRGRLRLSGAPPVSRPQRLPDRRDHPQPARQRPAARRGIRFLSRSGRTARDARRRRRRDPAGVRRHGRRHGAARRARAARSSTPPAGRC